MPSVGPMGGPQDDGVVALGQHDAHGVLLGADDDLAHQFPFRPQEASRRWI